MSNEMRRRTYLQIAGVGGIAAITGCSGTQPGTSGGSGNQQTETSSQTQTATATESPTPTEAPDPASFELDEIDFPSQVSVNEGFTPTISVTNTGDQAGSFSAPLYYRMVEEDWSETGEWEFGGIPPGETVTAEANEPWSFSYVGNYEFALGDFDGTASMRVIPKEIPYGDSYTNPDEIRLMVSSPEFKARYPRQVGDREDVVEAPEGKTFLFINVEAENASDEAQALPHYQSFHYLAGDREYEPDWDGYKDGRYEGGDVQPGVVRDGYLFYEVPEDVDRENPVIVWSEEYYYGRSTAFWGE